MFKQINDVKLIEKMKDLIIKITFIKDYNVFFNKEWLLENNYIAYANLIEYQNNFKSISDYDIDKKYYIIGITHERKEYFDFYIPSKGDFPIESVLIPNNLYLINKGINYDNDFLLMPPSFYLYVNKTFDLFGIIDTDLGMEYIAGDKKYFDNDFLEQSLIEKEKLLNYLQNEYFKEEIRHKLDYYESILKEQGYLD